MPAPGVPFRSRPHPCHCSPLLLFSFRRDAPSPTPLPPVLPREQLGCCHGDASASPGCCDGGGVCCLPVLYCSSSSSCGGPVVPLSLVPLSGPRTWFAAVRCVAWVSCGPAPSPCRVCHPSRSHGHGGGGSSLLSCHS